MMRALLAAGVLLGVGCGGGHCSTPAAVDGGAAVEAVDSVRPPDDAAVPTTSGSIAWGNLEGMIVGLERQLARDGRADTRIALAEAIATRGTFTAKIADYERALELAEAAVRDAPRKPEMWIARASARTTLHRFADALADLDEAEKRGAAPAETRTPRAAILQAQGDLDGALALRRAALAETRNVNTLGTEAALLGEMRRPDEAAALFREAALHYPNVSPLPVAWLFFQEALMWERAGKTDRARAFYAAAHKRLPVYAHVASHLAGLEPRARAIELLGPVAAASDDPEFEMLLAQRLRERGDQAEAALRLDHVRARYDEIVAAHPEAFAEHAATFWLEEGQDPKKAFALAQQNLALRKTDKAFQLAVLAGLAAGARVEACAAGAEGARRPYASETLRGILATACSAP